ncbi:unnamed protein product [Candidula unifasciata]|uniref:Centromere/kinetochore protein zw10 homolog n=1 Tax=Candidula unifasciata TaxID=100452 RepID=A0A8S3ZSQ8_9EUPU|nr:unnamed protein product [Candidula unifasciata]
MASSFVSRILEHADQLEQKSIQEKLDVLTMKLSEMEVEMHQLAESKYVHFHPNLLTADSLVQRVHDVQTEMSAIEDKVDTEVKGQLCTSVREYQSLNQELLEAKTVLAGLSYLAVIHEFLETSARSLEAKQYSQAAVALCKLQTFFQHPLTNQDEKIHILAAMRIELTAQFVRLECDLCNLWKDSIKWTLKTSPPETASNTDIMELSVSVTCPGDDHSQLEQLVEGLHVVNLLQGRMAAFAGWFQNDLVPFLTEHVNLQIVMTNVNQTRTLHISSQDGQSLSKPGNTRTKSNISEEKMYTFVFANLINILEQLHALFLHVGYGHQDGGHQDASRTSHGGPGAGTLMSLLGHSVSGWLLHLLKTTVLAKAVPSSAKDLEGFSQVIAATRLLQDQLLALGFIQADNLALMDYVQNVNFLFANKKSQATLEQAHTLMTSDLHEHVAVAEDKPSGEWPPLTPGGVKKGERMELAGDQKLSDNTLRMPRCRISENIQTLMTLAYDTLHEATESSPECATQMFYAVRSLFELFYHVVPTHHIQQFENFPQVAALHHNNCMFIAHHLLTLGHQFAPKLPLPDNKTYVDLIQKIRHSGVQVFVFQVNQQHDLLLQYLDGAEGFASVDKDMNFAVANKAVKQVLLQLSHLHKIWKPVLPVAVYKRAMGKLIGCVVEKVSYSITSLEDIAQEAAHRLTQLLAPLEQESGEFMTWPGEVASAELLRHVPGWVRLTELKFMLGANLSAISDRWAEGMGPLAVSFSPVEVKQLIRALFQNTDRRATILATIR